jgi:hypothetical protein
MVKELSYNTISHVIGKRKVMDDDIFFDDKRNLAVLYIHTFMLVRSLYVSLSQLSRPFRFIPLLSESWEQLRRVKNYEEVAGIKLFQRLFDKCPQAKVRMLQLLPTDIRTRLR